VSASAEADLRRVSALFERMGAAPQQAERMASQLLKRAEQLVEERGISYLEAVESLLKKVIEARSGDGGGVN